MAPLQRKCLTHNCLGEAQKFTIVPAQLSCSTASLELLFMPGPTCKCLTVAVKYIIVAHEMLLQPWASQCPPASPPPPRGDFRAQPWGATKHKDGNKLGRVPPSALHLRSFGVDQLLCYCCILSLVPMANLHLLSTCLIQYLVVTGEVHLIGLTCSVGICA